MVILSAAWSDVASKPVHWPTCIVMSPSLHYVCIDAKERLYFLRSEIPRPVQTGPGLVKKLHDRNIPITLPIQTDLIKIVRTDLRPAPVQPRAAQRRGTEPSRLPGRDSSPTRGSCWPQHRDLTHSQALAAGSHSSPAA